MRRPTPPGLLATGWGCLGLVVGSLGGAGLLRSMGLIVGEQPTEVWMWGVGCVLGTAGAVVGALLALEHSEAISTPNRG